MSILRVRKMFLMVHLVCVIFNSSVVVYCAQELKNVVLEVITAYYYLLFSNHVIQVF